MNVKERLLQHIYSNPYLPGSYGGIDALYRTIKNTNNNNLHITKKEVADFLSKNHTYGIHRKRNDKKLYVSRIIVSEPYQQWAADLEDMGQRYQHENDGYRFVLTVIDCFSRKAWVRPLRTKMAKDISNAFRNIVIEDNDGRPPLKLQTDKGTEFVNATMKRLYKQYHIRHFSTENEIIKASIVERFIRTLKVKQHRYMYDKQTRKWIDVLQDMVNAYNNRIHSAIGMKPNDVTFDNAHYVTSTLYNGGVKSRYKEKLSFLRNDAKKRKLAIGDYVRTTRSKQNAFERGYDATYTEEIFRIRDVLSKQNLEKKYLLEDLTGTPIKGAYYERELFRVAELPLQYRVRVLRRRNGRVLVHWIGYPDSMDSWIPENDLRLY